MGQIRLSGNPPIDVFLRRSARARRLSLRLSRLDGKVTLTLPKNLPLAEAEAFAREKESWLRGHLEGQITSERVGFGTILPIEGVECVVTQGSGRRIDLTGDQIRVPGQNETVGPKLRAYFKEQARARLSDASDRYARALGIPYSRITMRDTRSRWGSCSAEGNLMYSWRLILAPGDVLDYVAAHEVAHLKEMNHSKAFWDTVQQLYGPWKAQRKWLHDHGAGLHRFRFGD